MMTSLQGDVSAMFEEAVKSFDAAVKNGVKIQQDLTRVWTDALAKIDPVNGLDARTQALVEEAIPATQKTVEESLRLIEKAAQSSMDLMKKALEGGAVQSLPQAKEKTSAVWEATLAAVRGQAQALVDANSKVLEAWSQVGRKMAAKPVAKAMAGAK